MEHSYRPYLHLLWKSFLNIRISIQKVRSNSTPPVSPSSVYHSTPSYHRNFYMAYRSHPESRTARINSRTAALPSPLNNDLATSTEKDTQCVHFCGLFRLLVTCAMIEMLYDRIFCGHRMEIVIFSYICGAVAEKIASAQT